MIVLIDILGKTISDGFPLLVQHITESGGSIPAPADHPNCDRVVSYFALCDVPQSVLTHRSGIWDRITVGRSDLFYATESTLVKYISIFLEDILKAMKLPIHLENHLGIKHITPDICVLTYGNRLVGVVEVKKPDTDILLQPTVLGELFDQLLLIEGFYSSGPVIGILTTGVEWLFAWFTVDDNCFKEVNFVIDSNDQYLTPVKSDNPNHSSPVGLTPSQLSHWNHGLENEDDLPVDFSEFDFSESIQRVLSTTQVINIYDNYHTVFQHIYTSFIRMSQVKLNYRDGIPRCVFQLHKDQRLITWHAIKDIPINLETGLCKSRFPRRDTKNLLAIEDLGRGSSGRAWLACTQSENPAICVIKFSNKGDLEGMEHLNKEKIWWDRIYPEFSAMTKVEIWSGSYALVMPHFCSVPEDERRTYFSSIEQLLRDKFHAAHLIHNDVRWRNIGTYLNRYGESIVVLYDLQSVRESVNQTDNWIAEAMSNLFKFDSL